MITVGKGATAGVLFCTLAPQSLGSYDMRLYLYPAVAAATAMLMGCGSSHEARPGQQLSGLFLMRQDGKVGFVNKSGKLVIPPQFENAAPFSEGLAVVQVGSRAGY